MIFLETLPNIYGEGVTDAQINGLSSIGAMGTGIMLLFMLVAVGIYLYVTFAYKAIGKKAKDPAPSDAWIPSIGPLLIAYRASKMHWWPWTMFWGVLLSYIVLMIGAINLSTGLVGLGGVLYVIFLLIFGVMALVIWHWKMYESVDKPGWWAIIAPVAYALGFVLMVMTAISAILGVLGIIVIFLGILIQLILLGIAAWSKD